ncbi:Potassium efflux system KefA protein [Salmonella enterica subsp. enterica]|nr:Potassium efflux system KefA protein [Salmonella enterica subsp. enterica]
MRWTLFILFCLLGAPAHAVAIPGVTTGDINQPASSARAQS